MSTETLSLTDLGRRRSSILDAALPLFAILMVLVCLGLLAILIGDVVAGGWPVLGKDLAGLLQRPLSSLPARAGIAQGLMGSGLIAGIVALTSFPIGIAAAIYLEEYAKDSRFNRFIEVNIRNLAGVPSIVYGLLGVSVFVTSLRTLTGGRSLLAGALTLAVLALPVVIIVAAEAIRSVPVTVREAAYGLGATRWQVTRHQVLPAAAPGILTGMVLSLSRAIGETAPLLLIGAVTGFLATAGGGPVDALRGPFTTLPTIVFTWARQPSSGFRALTAAAIVVLVLVILLLNGFAMLLRNRYESRW